MLGKRCRTLQRTASITHNMGPHYLHHNNYHHYHDLAANHVKANAENILSSPSQSSNPHAPAIIPQIIGFNPIIKHDQSPQSKVSRPPDHPSAQNMSARPLPYDMYDDDPACANTHVQHKSAGGNITTAPVPSERSQITPRSALQTLLAAARQITCTDQSPALSKNEGNKSSLIKASAASPSYATSISAKQGLWQGFTLSESKSKEISTNQSLIKEAVITTETKSGPECLNVNMGEAESDQNLFYVEGTSNFAPVDRHTSLESEQNQHALYLATSPLAADLIPNLAASMSFMESCYLCKRPLGQGRDIFMYSRGESAFCSMECRDKQMRLEERKEKLRCMHFEMNNNIQKQELYTTTNIVSSNGAPHHQHHKPHHHHHHHEYSSQACGNKQHRTSLLMPAA